MMDNRAFSILPNETIVHIFGFFDSAKDICSLGSTSKALHCISTDESLWEAIFAGMRKTHLAPGVSFKHFREFGKTWLWLCKAVTPFDGSTGVGTKHEQAGAWFDVTTIQGDWVGGKAHGYAASTNMFLTAYEGGWERGKRSGLGFGEYADGGTYEGDWKGDRMHGYGLYTMPGVLRRIGEFKRHEYAGHGMTVWEDGGRFVGSYANDDMVEGTLYRAHTEKGRWSRLNDDATEVVARCGKIVSRKRKRGDSRCS